MSCKSHSVILMRGAIATQQRLLRAFTEGGNSDPVGGQGLTGAAITAYAKEPTQL
jgi:hypothetical protein